MTLRHRPVAAKLGGQPPYFCPECLKVLETRDDAIEHIVVCGRGKKGACDQGAHMTPEERATRLVAVTGARWTSWSAIRDTIREAIVDEREACARLVCPLCREGVARNSYGHHVVDDGLQPRAVRCSAAKIRARR